MQQLPSPAEEADILLAQQGGPERLGDCIRVISAQFVVIQTRTQVLLTLATITMTVTGFSGPKIASTGLFARIAMASGLLLVLAAVTILLTTLRIRFLTQFRGGDARDTLTQIIAYRNRKARMYLSHLFLLVAGLACYVMAVVDYLLHGS
jgi:hypothetical protein